MPLAMFQPPREKARPGIVWGERIIDLNAASGFMENRERAPGKFPLFKNLEEFLAGGTKAVQRVKRITSWMREQVSGSTRPLAGLKAMLFESQKVRLLPPLSCPPKILCLARNYASHVREVVSDSPLPQDLLIFMKPSTAIIGPEEPIIIPPECEKLDHEVELAVVIGQKGRYIPEEKAMDHVAGYTIFNDISDREYVGQKENPPLVNWFFMKGRDTFAPLGPYLVMKGEIKDPHGLRLRLWVNGELRQDSLGEEMIFKIPRVLSRISRFVTLEPGDVIATGTPTGTSFSTKKYLQAGDVVECAIEGMGRLRNFIQVKKGDYWKK